MDPPRSDERQSRACKENIPHLELAAAVLLNWLLTRVQTALKLSTAPSHLWVDSNIVLGLN